MCGRRPRLPESAYHPPPHPNESWNPVILSGQSGQAYPILERREEQWGIMLARIPNTKMQLLTIVALSLIAVVLLTGCPSPDMRLFFGEQRKSNLTVRKLDGRLKLRLDSFTARPCGDYDLYLSLEVAFSVSRDDIEFRPEEVQVLVADSVMQWKKESGTYARNDTAKFVERKDSPSKYMFTRHYRTFVEPSIVPENGELPVRIVLNEFITYKGQTVQFDTIQANERKGCNY